MSEVTIREAVEVDIPVILHLYAKVGFEGGEQFSIAEAAAHFTILNSYPYLRVFVAVCADEIVGTYQLLFLDSLAKRGRKSAVVENVAVAPDSQSQGIGRVMMCHALDQSRAAGCYKMTLSSQMKRTVAHEFYESLGFEKHGYSFLIQLRQ